MGATTPEGKVKAKVKKILMEYRAYQHWPVQAGYGNPTLDCIACYRGLYLAIETKAPGKKPTERQKMTIRHMQEAGATVFVIDGQQGYNELTSWLQKMSIG